MIKNSNKSGAFSLTELMVTIVIGSILIALATPVYNTYVIRSKFAEVMTAISYYKSMVAITYSDNESFPDEAENLTVNVATSSSYPTIDTILYKRSADKQKAYIHFYIADLGIANYTAADGNGSGGQNNRITLGILPQELGQTKFYCGRYDNSSQDIDLQYLPMGCQDANFASNLN